MLPGDCLARQPSREAVQPQPAQDRGRTDFDRDDLQSVVRRSKDDVANARETAAGEVDDLRVENVAAQPEGPRGWSVHAPAPHERQRARLHANAARGMPLA